MKRLFVIAFWLIMSPFVTVSPDGAQTPEGNLVSHCAGVVDLCGYVDGKSREVRIPLAFEGASAFSEGLAKVSLDGHAGFIDEAGKFVIEPQFEDAAGFDQRGYRI